MGNSRPFTLGITSDLVNENSEFTWGDISIGSLGSVPWRRIPESHDHLNSDQLSSVDAVLVGSAQVTAGSFSRDRQVPILIARFGVGYDSIDLEACTSHGVAVTITTEGSMRPVSTAALTLLLATLYRLPQKDQLARSGHWEKRLEGLGQGLSGTTVGCIGLGNVAQDFVRLLAPFEANVLAYDPWVNTEVATSLGVELVKLEDLLRRSDSVVVLAALTPENRGMIAAPQFDMMKSNAVLINISRGPLVVHADLVEALNSQKIWGAGLDVFEQEPPPLGDPLLDHPNVVVTPHNLGWTTSLATGMGHSAFTGIVDISRGQIPRNIVNRNVLENSEFTSRLEQYALGNVDG